MTYGCRIEIVDVCVQIHPKGAVFLVIDVAVSLELCDPALRCFTPYVEPAGSLLSGKVILNLNELNCSSETCVYFYSVYDSARDKVR